MGFRINQLAPAKMVELGDGRRCQFRADQNAIYALEMIPRPALGFPDGGLPVGAWLVGYGEEEVEVEPERVLNGRTVPARMASRRGRMLELAWALSASWRDAEDPEITMAEFASILPVGEAWTKLASQLEAIFLESFGVPSGPPSAPLEASVMDPAPPHPGGADTSRAG